MTNHKEFKLLNRKTQMEHTVVVHDTGNWHSFLPPTRGVNYHHTLAELQEFFDCSDEDLEMIKLKYGEPTPRVYRKVQVT